MSDKKVTGLGGVFIKAKNPKDLCAWYDKHLGTSFNNSTYMAFNWRVRDKKEQIGTTTFSFFKESTDYFSPSEKPVMLNFRVENLEATLEELKLSGVQVLGETQDYDYGKFNWIMDLEGNKIELWEPKDEKQFDEEQKS